MLRPSFPQYLQAAGAGAATVDVVQGEGRLQAQVFALEGVVGGMVEGVAVVVVVVVVGQVFMEAKLEATLVVPGVG